MALFEMPVLDAGETITGANLAVNLFSLAPGGDGIIAVLIGILLPALNSAREQSKQMKCLSNLRQIGQAMGLYTNEFKGYVVPALIQRYTAGAPVASRGEENWATMLVVRKYVNGASQLDLAGNGGTPPGEDAWQSPTSAGETVFRCPSGADQKSLVGNAGFVPPADKRDLLNAFFWRRQSQLSAGAGAPSQGSAPMIDTWYGANAIIPSPGNMINALGQRPFPMRVLAHNPAGGRIFGGPFSKVTQIKKSSEVAMIYDGLQLHDYNTNKISARHGAGAAGPFDAPRNRKHLGKPDNPYLAAMVEALDRGVGRVLDGLEQSGLAENTLVVFKSDNGGDGRATENEALRAAKTWLYEGGLRVPQIARWPGVIAPGTECARATSSIDYYPTFAEVAGGRLPEGQGIDGASLVPLLRGATDWPREALFWHYPADTAPWPERAGSAVRLGHWKLIEFQKGGRIELYDLERDLAEGDDLAAQRPNKAAELHRMLSEWRREIGVADPEPAVRG